LVQRGTWAPDGNDDWDGPKGVWHLCDRSPETMLWAWFL